MLSNLLRTGSMVAFLFGSVAFAAEQPVRVAASSNHYRAKQILGTKILIENNTAIGTVDDLVFDDAGNLEYIIVNNDGKLSTVPWEAARFDLEKKMATITLTSEQYKVIPTYTTTTYPNFYAPAYRNDVYKVYNVTPRELRRIERRQ